MSERRFLALVAATALLVAAAVFSVMRGDRAVAPPPLEQRVFPGLAEKLGDLAWMRLVHGGIAADFGAIGGHWAIVEKGNYPAAPGKVQHLLLALADLTLVEPKTRRPDLYGRLGLDDPSLGQSTEISVQDRTGAKLGDVIVGKSRPDLLGGGNDGVYVRKPGDDQTWLARGRLDLPGDMKDWLDRRIVDIGPARVASVTLTDPDGASLTLHRDKPGEPFAVAAPPPDAKFKDAAVLAAPAAALSDLKLDDVSPSGDRPVPQTGVTEAEYATFDGLTLKLRLFTDKVDWVALEVAGNDGAAAEGSALNQRLSRWDFAIPPERAKLLRTKLADLLAPEKGS